MTQKEAIITMLNAIQDIHPIIPSLKTLVEKDAVSDELLHTIITMLNDIKTTMKHTIEQEKIEKIIQKIQQIKHQEEQEKENVDIGKIDTFYQ